MEKGEYIGRFVNKWRNRTVAVYEHPTDKTKLVTVGFPFDGGRAVECVEDLKDWRATLEKIRLATTRGRVYVYE